MLLAGVCTSLLAFAGPALITLNRVDPTSTTEQRLPWAGDEILEHVKFTRSGERSPVHCMRRVHRAPTGSCATAAARGGGFSRHWSSRAQGDARRAHNGFGGPLLA